MFRSIRGIGKNETKKFREEGASIDGYSPAKRACMGTYP